MNNAGIMATPPGNTEEGYEIQVSLYFPFSNLLTKPKFGTNFIGHAVSLHQILCREQLPGSKTNNSIPYDTYMCSSHSDIA